MGDRCFPPRDDETHGSIQVTLAKEFNRISQYKTPFPLFWHAAWMVGNNRVQFPHRAQAFISFIDRILQRKDVYFVTNQQLLKWMRSPQTLEQLEENPDFFGCDFTDRPQKCNDFNTRQCRHLFNGDEVWWKTCQGNLNFQIRCKLHNLTETITYAMKIWCIEITEIVLIHT